MPQKTPDTLSSYSKLNDLWKKMPSSLRQFMTTTEPDLKPLFSRLNKISATVFVEKIRVKVDAADRRVSRLSQSQSQFFFSQELPSSPDEPFDVIKSLAPVIRQELNEALKNTPEFISFAKIKNEEKAAEGDSQCNKLTRDVIQEDIKKESSANLTKYLIIKSSLSILHEDVLFWVMKRLFNRNAEFSMTGFMPVPFRDYACLVKMAGEISDDGIKTLSGKIMIDTEEKGVYVANTPSEQALLKEYYDSNNDYRTQAMIIVSRTPVNDPLLQPIPPSPLLRPEATSQSTATPSLILPTPCRRLPLAGVLYSSSLPASKDQTAPGDKALRSPLIPLPPGG